MSRLRFLTQDARWALERAKRKMEKHWLLPRMSIPSPTPDLYDEVSVDKDLAITMRDGIRLYADLYRPKAEAKFPVILTRLPYGKGEFYCYLPAIGRYWARKGYAYVAQDVRGKWRSEGDWDPFVNEADDGYDTLDWIAGQPWCDGNIGMVGESYYGYTAWAAATTGHPNLKCISPSTTAMDIHGVWIYNNGAFCLQTMGTWAIEMNAHGYAHLIQEGIIRASYRVPDREPLPIEPGRVNEYTIDLWATSYVVRAGHQFRVEISSSNFNRYDRNLNTGDPLGVSIHPMVAEQRIFHTAEYPSQIVLPIILRDSQEESCVQ